MWYFQKKAQSQAYMSVSDVFTADEIQKIKSDGSNQWIKGGIGDETYIENMRNSNISWFYNEDEQYHWIFERLQEVFQLTNNENFNTPIYAMEDIQFTEYDSSYEGFYGKHIDAFRYLRTGWDRKLSVTVQLSESSEYEGGNTILYPGNKPVTLCKDFGSAHVFYSDIVHEVTPVTKGTRNSLVAWAIGPRV